MKKNITLLLAVAFFFSCNNDKYNKSENDVDAARKFIEASLKGDFKLARTYMVNDTANINRMDVIERFNLSTEERKGLAEANINIHDVNRLDSVTTIVVYSNSFHNDRDTLRIKKQENEWKVDFNYLFDHDEMPSNIPMLNSDSLSNPENN